MFDIQGFLQQISIQAIPLLLAITFHEAAHGWVAYKKGDPTAKMLGRVTLNPLAHIDPFGTQPAGHDPGTGIGEGRSVKLAGLIDQVDQCAALDPRPARRKAVGDHPGVAEEAHRPAACLDQRDRIARLELRVQLDRDRRLVAPGQRAEGIERIAGDGTIFEKEPLEGLAHDGQLMAYKHAGFWQPMDTLRDKQHLEVLWNGGKAPWKIWG